MQTLITVLLFPFVTIYMIIPFLFTRILGFFVFSKGTINKQIAFTFDDGPDPKYTPELLDMLQEFRVKATFFVLGNKAEKYPELIRRMHEDGHLIGIHNYTHSTPNWIMTPWKIKRKQVDRTADIVRGITGERPIYYRPPWGILNLGDVIVLRKAYKIVLWSVMAGDWKSKVGADKLKRILLKNIKSGSIILLHDSGDTPGADEDAPKNMLEGLREVILDLNQREYSCVRIDHLIGQSSGRQAKSIKWSKRALVRLWLAWDWLFCKLFAVRMIDPNMPFFKLRAVKYKGDEPIEFPNGEIIRRGDKVAELHLNNKILYQFSLEAKSSLQLAAKIIRNTQNGLPHVLNKIETDPKYRGVKGLYGITLIHRGATQLGFMVSELPDGAFARVSKVYLRLLLYALHPDGKKRTKVREELLVPKRITMSRQQLMDRYTHSG